MSSVPFSYSGISGALHPRGLAWQLGGSRGSMKGLCNHNHSGPATMLRAEEKGGAVLAFFSFSFLFFFSSVLTITHTPAKRYSPSKNPPPPPHTHSHTFTKATHTCSSHTEWACPSAPPLQVLHIYTYIFWIGLGVLMLMCWSPQGKWIWIMAFM